MANYGYTGWIKLYRAEMLGPFYGEKRVFSKWEAWMNLCMMADDTGTVKTSLETLQNQWSWGSTHKVRAFLDTVQDTGLGTVIKIPNKGTSIRINTEFYDKKKTRKKGGKGTVKDTVKGIEESSLKEEEDENPTDISSPEGKNITTADGIAAELEKWRDLNE